MKLVHEKPTEHQLPVMARMVLRTKLFKGEFEIDPEVAEQFFAQIDREHLLYLLDELIDECRGVVSHQEDTIARAMRLKRELCLTANVADAMSNAKDSKNNRAVS